MVCEPLSLTDQLNEAFAFFLAIGMPSDEYWYGEHTLTKAYYTAFKAKRRQSNELAWLNGLYNYHAFGIVLSNAFAKKGRRPQKYMDKPLDIFGEEKRHETQGERAEKERQKAIAYFNHLERAWKERHTTE